MSSSVGEMRENRRFFEDKSLFVTETQMFLCSACRIKRMPSIEASFEGITRVFKELSPIKYEMSSSAGEMHENRSFFENK